MRISKILIVQEGIEITSYEGVETEDIDKIREYERKEKEDENESDRVQEALVDVLFQKPFIFVFENEPRTIRMLSDFSPELLSFAKDVLLEHECFRAAEECKNLINEINEIEDGEI